MKGPAARPSGLANLPNSPYLGVGLPASMPYSPYLPGTPSSSSLSNYSTGAASPSIAASPTFNIPPTTGITALPASTPLPAEAQVRLRYVELQVAGLNTAGDKNRLEQTLNKLKEVRGVSIKARPDGSAGAKVWYSEKDPVHVDELIEATAKLGFTASAN